MRKKAITQNPLNGGFWSLGIQKVYHGGLILSWCMFCTHEYPLNGKNPLLCSLTSFTKVTMVWCSSDIDTACVKFLWCVLSWSTVQLSSLETNYADWRHSVAWMHMFYKRTCKFRIGSQRNHECCHDIMHLQLKKSKRDHIKSELKRGWMLALFLCLTTSKKK